MNMTLIACQLRRIEKSGVHSERGVWAYMGFYGQSPQLGRAEQLLTFAHLFTYQWWANPDRDWHINFNFKTFREFVIRPFENLIWQLTIGIRFSLVFFCDSIWAVKFGDLKWCHLSLSRVIYLLSIFLVEEYGEHFERKEVTPRPPTLSSRKSALSLKLEEFDQNVNNPFMEYAKFDGRVGSSVYPGLSLSSLTVCSSSVTFQWWPQIYVSSAVTCCHLFCLKTKHFERNERLYLWHFHCQQVIKSVVDR